MYNKYINTKMYKKYIKRCSISLAFSEMQIKPIVRCHCTPRRMTLSTKTKYKVKGLEKMQLLFTSGGNVDWIWYLGKQAICLKILDSFSKYSVSSYHMIQQYPIPPWIAKKTESRCPHRILAYTYSEQRSAQPWKECRCPPTEERGGVMYPYSSDFFSNNRKWSVDTCVNLD